MWAARMSSLGCVCLVAVLLSKEGNAGDVSLRHPSVNLQHELPGRVLVIYAWYDVPHERENLWFFLEHVVKSDMYPEIDFLFVDTTEAHRISSGIPIPEDLPNVKVLRRANIGFDMCSYKKGLELFQLQDYFYFILMNGSVRGPFLSGVFKDAAFYIPFVQMLDPTTRLAGTTVFCSDEHLILQGSFLVTDQVGIELINSTLRCEDSKGYDIEESLTAEMLNAGFNIAPLQLWWRNHNFLDAKSTRERCGHFLELREAADVGGEFLRHWHEEGEPLLPGHDVHPDTLEMKDVDPHEVIMFKTNRGVAEGRLQNLTEDCNYHRNLDKSPLIETPPLDVVAVLHNQMKVELHVFWEDPSNILDKDWGRRPRGYGIINPEATVLFPTTRGHVVWIRRGPHLGSPLVRKIKIKAKKRQNYVFKGDPLTSVAEL